jgi:hypothetical protein
MGIIGCDVAEKYLIAVGTTGKWGTADLNVPVVPLEVAGSRWRDSSASLCV